MKGIKNWLKKQFISNPKNLKAIGIGFLWAVGVSAVLGMIGLSNSAIGVFVWIVASYKYQKKFAKLAEQKRQET